MHNKTNINELYSIYLQYPNICTDTRKITPDCLFFALKGGNFDGNQFAEQAIAQGAKYVVIDNKDYQKDEHYLLVDDVLLTLQDLARTHRKHLNIPVIGLTGSNGKTTSKELINAVLSQKYTTLATQGNLNNHIGVPLTLLSIGKETEIAIVEMGANHQKEIELLCSIAQPTHGLITNIGKAHLEGFGGEEGIKKGKGELFEHLSKHDGVVFVNQNSTKIVEAADMHHCANRITYGNDAACDVRLLEAKNIDYVEVEWCSERFASKTQKAFSNLTGIYNAENILAAIAIGLHFRIKAENINDGIKAYEPQNMRSQFVKTDKNTLIVDAYNANPSSMNAALENLATLAHKHKVAILGDMFELGDYATEEHLKVLQQAESLNLDCLVLVGKHFAQVQQHKTKAQTLFFTETDQVAQYLTQQPISQKLVLVKGSRGMKLEGLLGLL